VPTEVKHALRTTAAWSADQAAMEAIYGVGGYYTTPAAWDAAQQRDIVAADEIAILEVYDDWPSGAAINYLDLLGWTADATRQLIIRAAPGEEYDVATDTGAHITGGTGYLLIARAGTNCVIEDIKFTAAGSSYHVVDAGWLYDVVLNRCYIEGTKGAGASAVNHSIIKNAGYYSLKSCVANNCVIISEVGYGAYSGQMPVRGTECHNVAIYNETVGGYGSFYDCTGDYNAAEDTSAPGANSIDSITTAEFEDYAGGDYHLASGSQLIGAGDNLIVSGGLSSPQYDIDGQQWPDTGDWDIGFDYRVGGGSAQSITGNVLFNNTPTADINHQQKLAGTVGVATSMAAEFHLTEKLTGAVDLAASPTAALTHTQKTTGDVALGLSPAAAWQYKQKLAGAINWNTSPGAVFGGTQAIAGNVVFSALPATLFSYSQKTTGEVTLGVSPAALFGGGQAITGAVAFDQSPAALLSHRQKTSGAVGFNLAASAGLNYAQNFNGALDFDLSAGAGLNYAQNINGDIDLGLSPAAQLGYGNAAAITGSVTFDISVLSDFATTERISGDIDWQLTPNAMFGSGLIIARGDLLNLPLKFSKLTLH